MEFCSSQLKTKNRSSDLFHKQPALSYNESALASTETREHTNTHRWRYGSPRAASQHATSPRLAGHDKHARQLSVISVDNSYYCCCFCTAVESFSEQKNKPLRTTPNIFQLQTHLYAPCCFTACFFDALTEHNINGTSQHYKPALLAQGIAMLARALSSLYPSSSNNNVADTTKTKNCRR